MENRTNPHTGKTDAEAARYAANMFDTAAERHEQERFGAAAADEKRHLADQLRGLAVRLERLPSP